MLKDVSFILGKSKTLKGFKQGIYAWPPLHLSKVALMSPRRMDEKGTQLAAGKQVGRFCRNPGKKQRGLELLQCTASTN